MRRDPALDAIVAKLAQHHGHCAQTGFFSMVEWRSLECYGAAGGLQKCVNAGQTRVHIASGIVEESVGQ